MTEESTPGNAGPDTTAIRQHYERARQGIGTAAVRERYEQARRQAGLPVPAPPEPPVPVTSTALFDLPDRRWEKKR